MNNHLSDLINRMADNSDWAVVRSSTETISWKASREAEKISDLAHVPEIIAFIKAEKDKKKREKAYFLLSCISKNTNDKHIVESLIGQILAEVDGGARTALLDKIKYLVKTKDIDVTPIIQSIHSENWALRRSAIAALSYSKNDLAEDALLDVLQHSTDEYDLWYAVGSLQTSGSKKSMPHLMKLLAHKKQDISESALNAMVMISDGAEMPVFIEQLEKGRNKPAALMGVIKFGDVSSIPYVVKRIKELVAKKRAREVTWSDGKTEIILAMGFLASHADQSDAFQKMHELLTTKKNDRLWPSEKKWLRANMGTFAKPQSGCA